MNLEYDPTTIEEGDVVEDEDGNKYTAEVVNKSGNNNQIIWSPKE